MCGRFGMDDTVNELITEFRLATGKGPDEWTPSWNIAPTDDIPVLCASQREGDVENRFLVYDRAGEPCPRCRRGVIEVMTLGGRTSAYCARCQTLGGSSR